MRLHPTHRALLLALVMGLAGCGGASEVTDAGRDGGGAENAACANLVAIDQEGGCLSALESEEACLASFMELRMRAEASGCQAEYDALVACVTDVPSCPDAGDGVLCPMQYSTLGSCVSM